MNAEHDCCVAVIGGGAAGLMAAITAAESAERHVDAGGRACRVLLIEKSDRVGKKILATGNGRCNLGNTQLTPDHYHGRDRTFTLPVLEQFALDATRDFFRQSGLMIRQAENGRLYPYSLQASAVLDILRQLADRLGVETLTGSPVTSITPLPSSHERFTIQTEDGRTYRACSVVLATGGMAGSGLGCDGSGYRLAKVFGHQTTPLFPALVQIRTETKLVRKLAGIKVEGTARVMNKDQCLAQSDGEILFAEYGLSGPPLLDLSRTVSEQLSQPGSTIEIELDLVPNLSEEDLVAWFYFRQIQQPDLSLEHFLTGLVHKKLGQVLIKHCLGDALTLAAPIQYLEHEHLTALSHLIKHLGIPVVGTRSWAQAQVTAGGLETHDFDAPTLQSNLQPGLFAAGEILDVDGDCGGYNLQWAWSSGRIAGSQAMAFCLGQAGRS